MNVIDNIDDLNAHFGSKEVLEAVAADGSGNALIPDQVKAPGEIVKVELQEYMGEHNINISYK